MHTTVLESPPGHNCLTLAGAQPGGADADSKEAEEERVSDAALSLTEGNGHPFTRADTPSSRIHEDMRTHDADKHRELTIVWASVCHPLPHPPHYHDCDGSHPPCPPMWPCLSPTALYKLCCYATGPLCRVLLPPGVQGVRGSPRVRPSPCAPRLWPRGYPGPSLPSAPKPPGVCQGKWGWDYTLRRWC
jgi:hypothetical protein